MLLVLGLIVFGIVVEIRSALQKHRRTDFGVYARAGWAARVGINPYTVEDDRGWHYCYPLPFALAMIPLADPPPGESRAGMLPFEVSVGIWYLLHLACWLIAIDRLARIILPDEPRFSRRWWYARTGPFTIAIGAIGHSLARGQVNGLVIALVVLALTERLRHRSFAAGGWLGLAVCVKMIPIYLGLYFLIQRDFRALAGLAATLFLALGVLPLTVWSPQQTLELHRNFASSVLQPGATGTGDQTRAVELTNVTATDSQSIQTVLHNAIHADPFSRPAHASGTTRLMHWGIGCCLTALTFVVLRKLPQSPVNEMIQMGTLCVLMLHLSPISHMHYYAFAVPLLSAVWLKEVSGNSERVIPCSFVMAVLITWAASTTFPLFDLSPAVDWRMHGVGLAGSYVLVRVAMGMRQSRISAGLPSNSPRIRLRAMRLML